jgi:wobble nucleotide-excising tRNase
MISKIVMNKIGSFKKSTTLETDKKVNIMYGLNGTGKTTISDFLYYQEDHKFSNCSIDVPINELLLVYNTSFIQENFYKKPNQDCIFTLSKENKTAEENIKKAREEIVSLEMQKKEKEELCASLSANKTKHKEQMATKTWEIKTKYSGGDRVLEYCLDRLKGNKDTLFDHICKVTRPETLPVKSIDELKKEVTLLSDSTSSKYNLLPNIISYFDQIEKDEIFGKIIVGNENSIVAGLIKQLNNADWVKLGLKYISTEDNITEKPTKCPFCQQETITRELFTNINNYFDEEYEREITILRGLLSEYTNFFLTIKKDEYEGNPFVDEVKSEFEKRIDSIISCLNKNIKTIQDKIVSPSQKYYLDDTSLLIAGFNSLINGLNEKIKIHNLKIDNKQQALNDIKTIFWEIMRYNYDIVISNYLTTESKTEKEIEAANVELNNIEQEIKKQFQIIEIEQRKTVNIDEAIGNINNNLLELGIDDFRISKYHDNFYKIIRDDTNDNTFLTLSEGEKMMISFLYFLELCKGKKDITEVANKKIIIIDDPISSLSHVFVFNVGEFIKREFCNSSKFEQVFIFTHSLYFFYEMTFTNPEKREKEQNLFRITKNSQGSSISAMKYEEIQNDYHSYWSVINNPDYPHAIQANCMRNIIEYFFGFIEKKDLNNVFQKKNLQDARFSGFCRFINRESHSIGQNIFDYKEFDYDIFREALKLLFYESGYQEHYDKMSKIK